jgi:hypothetical protein
VVGDDDARLADAAASGHEKTGREESTLAVEAVAAFTADGVPQLWGDGTVHVRMVTSLRLFRPRDESSKIACDIVIWQKRLVHICDFIQLAQTQIVGTAFRDNGVYFDVEKFGEKRNIAIENLVLQADGMSRDDDWFVHLTGMKECGHKISERLSDACGGFDAEVFVVVEGIGDGIGHIDLLLPRLVFEGDAVRGVGVPQGGIVTEKGFSLFFYHADKLLVEKRESVRRDRSGKLWE